MLTLVQGNVWFVITSYMYPPITCVTYKQYVTQMVHMLQYACAYFLVFPNYANVGLGERVVCYNELHVSPTLYRTLQ